jgi:hypothetical protein
MLGLNDVHPLQLLRFLTGHEARVTAVSFMLDDVTLLSGSLDVTILGL